MWPIYNWKYKDLSISCDQKAIKILTPIVFTANI